MPPLDYYALLSVSRNAGDDEINKAFRKKAFDLHPDRSKRPDAEERFKEINAANQVLSDPKERAKYDKILQRADAAARPKSGRAQNERNAGHTRANQNDRRSQAGRDAGRERPQPGNTPPTNEKPRPPRDGADIRQIVELTREEALTADEKEINVSRYDHCRICSGSGKSRAKSLPHCPGCQGKGVVQRVCRLAVKIPAGIKTGYRVRLTGQGSVGRNGGKAGNVYLRFEVREKQAKPRPNRATRPSYTSNSASAGSYTGPSASPRGNSREDASAYGNPYGGAEYPIVCALCGVNATVSFKPRYSSPLYCRTCYKVMRG